MSCSTDHLALDGRLSRTIKTAASCLNKWIRRVPRERWSHRFSGISRHRASEQEQLPTWSHERLQSHQYSRLDTNGSHGKQIVRFVQVRPRQQLLEASRDHIACARSSARRASLRKTDLRVFRLDHQELMLGIASARGIAGSRRPSDVDRAPNSRADMTRRHDRFDE
jgi:hypothetical protein